MDLQGCGVGCPSYFPEADVTEGEITAEGAEDKRLQRRISCAYLIGNLPPAPGDDKYNTIQDYYLRSIYTTSPYSREVLARKSGNIDP